MHTKKNLVPFILVTCLFFLWAFLHNINPILIPHLKKACRLNDTQSAFIDTAVYFAYFVIAVPAGWFIYKFGYKKGILFGLLLFALGFLLFIPAASQRAYWLFLTALFIGASGATFLETVANPYIIKLGNPSSAPLRINLAQSFNGIGAFLAPIIGGQFILSGVEHTPTQIKEMDTNGTLNAYLSQEADTIKMPYLIMGCLVVTLLIVLYFTRLPEIKEDGEDKSSFSLKVFRHKHFTWAVLAQLFYVGAQTCTGSFFIRFSKYVAHISEKNAAFIWGSIAMVGFMVGRFTGTLLLKYIKATKLLLIYALINTAIVLVAVTTGGTIAVYTLMAVPFFMSIMYPTIFAMGISGLGEETKIASSFLVMAIVGGAILPIAMGAISDATGGNIQLAYLVPAVAFMVIAAFAFRFRNLFTTTAITAH
jgi:FHS family L-fucose permease-like MFS transporter